MAKISKKMFGYDILYNDDLRSDGRAVRTVWPDEDDVFPTWFLDKITARGWDYEVIWSTGAGVKCIDLV
jgi:hypothetical protein